MKYIKSFHLFENRKNSFPVSNQIKKEINIARKEFDIYKKYFEKVAGNRTGSNIGKEEEGIEDEYYLSTIDIGTVDYNSHIQSVYYFDGRKVLYLNLKFIASFINKFIKDELTKKTNLNSLLNSSSAKGFEVSVYGEIFNIQGTDTDEENPNVYKDGDIYAYIIDMFSEVKRVSFSYPILILTLLEYGNKDLIKRWWDITLSNKNAIEIISSLKQNEELWSKLTPFIEDENIINDFDDLKGMGF